MRSRPKAILLGSFTCLSFTAAGAAKAQDAPLQNSEPALASQDDIVVTARGRVERLQDVPVSASVVSGTGIQERAVFNLQDLSTRLPNVKITNSPQSDFLNIRGVGSSANTGFEQSVGTFVDGFYRGRSRNNRNALLDVDRVEVLKGPQTTFFGNNTIAGALNITTRQPGASFEANAIAFYAPAFDEYSVEAGVTVPISENLSTRIAGRLSGMGGYIYNTRRGNKGPGLESQTGRVAVRWDATPDVAIDARVDVGRTRDRHILDVELTNCPPDPVFPAGARGACARYVAGVGAANVDDEVNLRSDTGDGKFFYDFTEAAGTATIALGDNSLIFKAAHFHHDYNFNGDVVPVPRIYASTVGTTTGLPLNNYENFDQSSGEVRFQSAADGILSYTLGLYYATTDAVYDSYVGYYFASLGAAIGRPTDPVALRIINTEKSKNFSVFGAIGYKVTDNLTLNLAGRYSNVRKEAHRDPRVGTGGNYPSPENFVRYTPAQEMTLRPLVGEDPGDNDDPTRTDSKFLPSVSIQYEPARNAMIYASYNKGFKAGGYAASAVKSEFKGEEVDAYELGVKGEFLDSAVVLNLAGFYSKYSNLQEATTSILPSGVSLAIIGNVASSVSKGIELGMTVRPMHGLVLRADVAYLDSSYRAYPNAPCTVLQIATRPAPCRQDLAGVRRPFAPRYSGTFGAAYSFPIGTLEARIDGSVFLSGRYFLSSVADPFLEQAAYAKVDLRLAIGSPDRSWELAIVGRNLTDKVTVNYALGLPGSAGSFYKLPDAPRSVGFQASTRF